MKENKKKLIIGLILIGFISGFVWILYERKTEDRLSSKNSEKIINDNNSEMKTLLFQFQTKNKILLNGKHSLKEDLIIPEKNLNPKWKVINILNYYYPDWREKYTFSKETLLKKIERKNILWFQPKLNLKFLIYRKDCNITFLEKNELIKELPTSYDVFLKDLIEMIRDDKNDWNTVKTFIEMEILNKKLRKKIIDFLEINILDGNDLLLN